MSDKLLVFIPCYNCAPQIARVLRQFTDPQVAGRFDEILVLDNNSSDATREIAIEAARAHLSAAAVTIARNRDNYNLGGSHKAAFGYARANGFSHVVVLHGDDQGDIRDLLPVLDSGQHRAVDAALGARFMRGSRLSGYSAFRILGNRVFNALFSLRMGTAVKDLGSGLNIFGRAVLQDERVMRYADDLRFNIYLLLGLHAQRLELTYFPISWREDDQLSNVRMMSQAMRTLALLWQSGAGERFWSADHRSVRHAAYEFDAIYRSP